MAEAWVTCSEKPEPDRSDKWAELTGYMSERARRFTSAPRGQLTGEQQITAVGSALRFR